MRFDAGDGSDTISAVSTPAGRSCRGITRLSGPGSIEAAARLAGRPAEQIAGSGTYRAIPLTLQIETLSVPATAYVMRKPGSYTREDVVELHTVGNPALQEALGRELVRLGCRPAEAGEFTRRAFLNGRISLAQAEAVQALIRSRSDAEARQASAWLAGRSAVRMRHFRERLVSLAAEVELGLDFSDQDVAIISRQDLQRRIRGLRADAGKWLGDGAGRVASAATRVILYGPPNAGKSSLFNAILQRNRAIVSPHPGTTRDAIEASLSLNDEMDITLVDTAGMRSSADEVEAVAVAGSAASVASGDLCVCVLDAHSTPNAETAAALERFDPARAIICLNKCDLGARNPDLEIMLPDEAERIAVSASTGAGLADLLYAIGRRIENGIDRSAAGWAVNCRQAHLGRRIGDALARAEAASANGDPLELIAGDLAEALACLAELTGESVSDSILDNIFASFCIGK